MPVHLTETGISSPTAKAALTKRRADLIADSRRKRAIGKEARAGVGTLTVLLDLYAKKKGAKLKSWPECRRRIDSVSAAHP